MTTQTQLCKIISPKAERALIPNLAKLKLAPDFASSHGEHALAFVSAQGIKTHPTVFVTFRGKTDSNYSTGAFESRTLMGNKSVIMVDFDVSAFLKTASSLRLTPNLQIESVLVYKLARIGDEFTLLGELQRKLWKRHDKIVNGNMSLYFQGAMLKFMPSMGLGKIVNQRLYETIVSLEAALFASKCLAAFIERRFLLANATPVQFEDWINHGMTRDTIIGGEFVAKLESRRGEGSRELLLPTSDEMKKPKLFAERIEALYESIRNS